MRIKSGDLIINSERDESRAYLYIRNKTDNTLFEVLLENEGNSRMCVEKIETPFDMSVHGWKVLCNLGEVDWSKFKKFIEEKTK